MNDATPSAAERGDTVPRWVRWLVRVAAVAVFVGGAVAVAWVRHDDQPEQDAAPSQQEAAAKAQEAEPDPLAHAGRETRLLDDEDARLRAVSLARVEGVGRPAHTGTLVLDARPAPYTLADLLHAAAAHRTSASVVELTEPVVVRRDARLEVVAPGTTLRLRSTSERFTSLVSWGGSITLAGTAKAPLVVTSWDPGSGTSDHEPSDGRAYVRVKDGALRVAHARFRELGFWSGRTGGLALTGSDETTATADLDDVRLENMHLGLYLSGAERVRAAHLRVTGPQRHGVEVTNRSRDVRFTDLTVRSAGEDAVSVSNGSSHVELTDARLAGTEDGYGIDVNGSPLADGLNSAGYGIDNYAWLRLDHVRTRGNSAGGVRVKFVDHLTIDHLTATSDRSALVVSGAAQDVSVADSTLASSDGTAVVLEQDVTDASVSHSTLQGLATGIEVDGSQATVDHNEITVGTGHGVLVTGSGAEATVSGNTIDGRGSSAVHGSDGAQVTESGTDGNWTYRPEVVMWAERHAAAMPLLAVLVVPIAGLVFVLRRRRQQRELRRIFEATLVARGRAAIDGYAVAAVVEPTPVPEPSGTSADEPVGPVGPVEPARPAAVVPLAEREFTTAREFAIAAVQEAGYPPNMVARVLHVPTSRVREWISGLDQSSPGGVEEGSGTEVGTSRDTEPV